MNFVRHWYIKMPQIRISKSNSAWEPHSTQANWTSNKIWSISWTISWKTKAKHLIPTVIIQTTKRSWVHRIVSLYLTTQRTMNPHHSLASLATRSRAMIRASLGSQACKLGHLAMRIPNTRSDRTTPTKSKQYTSTGPNIRQMNPNPIRNPHKESAARSSSALTPTVSIMLRTCATTATTVKASRSWPMPVVT